MADFPVTGKYVHAGHNRSNLFEVTHVIGATPLANTDTLTVTLPTGAPVDALPIAVQAFTDATPAVRNANIGITSHNRTTGVTVLTATGAVAVGSLIRILYAL